MSRFTIAAGEETKKRLSAEDLGKKLYADSLNYCSTPQELENYINNTDVLVVYSDFALPYSDVCSMVKQSKTVNNVIGMEYADAKKIWLYDGVTVANCIQPGEEAPAIQRALTVPKTVNFIGQWVVAILLTFFLTSAVMYTHHQYMAYKSGTEVQQTEESENLLD